MINFPYSNKSGYTFTKILLCVAHSDVDTYIYYSSLFQNYCMFIFSIVEKASINYSIKNIVIIIMICHIVNCYDYTQYK